MAGTSDLHGLAADFERAGAQAERMADQATRKAGADVVAGAQRRAPVRKKPTGGYLRSSIGAEELGTADVEVGPAAHYGVYLEYGTSKMAPRPYLFPAFDEVTPSFENAISQIGDRIL